MRVLYDTNRVDECTQVWSKCEIEDLEGVDVKAKGYKDMSRNNL